MRSFTRRAGDPVERTSWAAECRRCARGRARVDDRRPYILSIDHLLTDEERLTWQAARDFGVRRIAPVIEQHCERGTFPRELIPEFAAMGFLGAPLHGYGCAGMSDRSPTA